MLVVRYEDGNTFGRCYGNWEIIGLYNNHENLDEIRNIRKSIENDTYTGSKPWKGYFARFTSVEAFALPILF